MASAPDVGVVAGMLPAMATLFAILVLGERPGLPALLGSLPRLGCHWWRWWGQPRC